MWIAHPHRVFVVGYQTAALKALNNKDRQRKTVKSMTVSHGTPPCSSQSYKVAPLALLLAPTCTKKIARFVNDTRVQIRKASAFCTETAINDRRKIYFSQNKGIILQLSMGSHQKLHELSRAIGCHSFSMYACDEERLAPRLQ